VTVLNEIAFYQNRRDEVPNQELAKKLAETCNEVGIKEIAEALFDKNISIASDCLKVLYEISYIAPELVSRYVPEFLKLTYSKNNRLVWGAMIALSKTAGHNPDACLNEVDHLKRLVKEGSVITQDNGIKTLAALAAVCADMQGQIFPFLLEHLQTCRSKDVPQRAKSILPAVTVAVQEEFLEVLSGRLPGLSNSQAKRVEKLMRNLKKK